LCSHKENTYRKTKEKEQRINACQYKINKSKRKAERGKNG
jgi:hypothetical protein